ncbi:hypothetical protein AWC38_SpisGene5656 [Stylophora pistillata]|uniref:Uncharacterized protein n=1 Tax=Stylophora pistillata TaxID=50429 RepID=A0A2B4SJS5_STYPI|nr:hypothetical protein AWC38_SpisGene5656 [Stylophora pistillata]
MQLTSLKGITKYNVIFEEATTNQHGHQRINIKAKHTCGENKAGPLVIASPFRFSFGVQPSLSKSDVTGCTLPTPLWNPQEGEPTQKEFAFYHALKELKHICYEHLDEFYGTDVAESIKFPLVEKEGKAPVLYPRLMYSQKSDKIRTLFHSKEESKVEPLECLDYCKVKMTIVVDSIYLGDDCKATKAHITSTTVMMQLTDIKKIEDNIIFEKAVSNCYGDKCINIRAKHGCGEGKPGPLVIASPFLSSFGVQKSLKDDDITKCSLPTLLWEWGVQQNELDFYAALIRLRDLCYEHLSDTYGEFEAEKMKFPLTDERGVDKGQVPILYPKLMKYTLFHTKYIPEIDPLKYLDQYCKVKMTIVVDSIYMDSFSRSSVQLKIHDVYVNPQRLMQPLATLSKDEEDKLEGEMWVDPKTSKLINPKTGEILKVRPAFPHHFSPHNRGIVDKLLSLDPKTVPFYPSPAALSNVSESKYAADSEEDEELKEVVVV